LNACGTILLSTSAELGPEPCPMAPGEGQDRSMKAHGAPLIVEGVGDVEKNEGVPAYEAGDFPFLLLPLGQAEMTT